MFDLNAPALYWGSVAMMRGGMRHLVRCLEVMEFEDCSRSLSSLMGQGMFNHSESCMIEVLFVSPGLVGKPFSNPGAFLVAKL